MAHCFYNPTRCAISIPLRKKINELIFGTDQDRKDEFLTELTGLQLIQEGWSNFYDRVKIHVSSLFDQKNKNGDPFDNAEELKEKIVKFIDEFTAKFQYDQTLLDEINRILDA